MRAHTTVLLALLLTVLLGSLITQGGLSGKQGYREFVVSRGDITSRALTTGRVQPQSRLDVRAALPGRAEQVLVSPGDHVEKGQPLIWMSSSDRASILDAARVSRPQDVALWEKKLRPVPILSPTSGTVIQRNIKPGQTFTTTDALIVIADRMVVEAPVDETDLALLRRGQSATIQLDAYPNQTLSGSINSLAFEKRVENGVTTYMVKVDFADVPEFVRVGMTANVRFEIATKRSTLVLPMEALRSTESSLYVLRLPESGDEPEPRAVETGISDGRKVEILSGLEQADVVLVPTRSAPEDKLIEQSALSGGTVVDVAE